MLFPSWGFSYRDHRPPLSLCLYPHGNPSAQIKTQHHQLHSSRSWIFCVASPFEGSGAASARACAAGRERERERRSLVNGVIFAFCDPPAP